MIFYYIFNLIVLIFCSVYILKYLHIYQLKNYNNQRYFKYFFNKNCLFIGLCLVLFIFELIFNNLLLYIVANTFILILNMFYMKKLVKSQKTPIKFTKKLQRIYIFSIFIMLAMCFFNFGGSLIFVLLPTIPSLANFINIYDKILNSKFIKRAQEKINISNAKIIAITGSNGKTSVKNILFEMLSHQFKTQASPESYNTPIGIAKFINEQIRHDTKFIILEYGARHKNDIKKLCHLFGANYGIVTTVSAQHIETFKSVENVFKAKKELMNFLQNKPCVFNIDNLYCLRMHQEKISNKISTSIHKPANVYAKNIKIENFQTTFDLVIGNTFFNLSICLLGRHNISNICLASAMACHLGVEKENIINAIKNLLPTPHRLQLIKSDINILDDSYNCSFNSAQEAMFVLEHSSGKKMVATPGIIEGGKMQFQINQNLGKMLSSADFCVIIGKHNREALVSGIKKATAKSRLPKILFSNSLEQAKTHFSLLAPNDTLLFLNDLPDDYC